MQIPLKIIFNQLKNDLIGKDSHRGITLTYAWMANQFGHFALGFIPTLILAKIFDRHFSDPLLKAFIAVALFWTIFEAYNFLGPLFKLKKKSSFRPNYKNIGFDTFTDLCFFYIGGLSFYCILEFQDSVFIALCILLFLVLFFTAYWFITKLYMQFSGFPFQLRLSQYTHKMSSNSVKICENFVQLNVPQHLFVFGNNLSGKTSLSVSLGTEKAIRHNKVSYLTANKLLDEFYETNEQSFKNNPPSWTWRLSSCVVIDDINPGKIDAELLTADLFFNHLNNSFLSEENIKAILNQQIIWVIGNRNYESAWRNSLTKIGVSNSSIESIYLE